MKQILTFIVFLIFSNTSMAERMLKTDGFIGQPMLFLKEGNVDACGIRFMGVQTPVDVNNPKEKLWVVDASFMLNRAGYGAVKATLNSSTVGSMMKSSNTAGDLSVVSFETFWIKAAGAEASQSIATGKKTLDGENKGSRMYPTEAMPVIKLYEAAISGEPILIGYKFKKGSDDFAFSAKVTLTEEESNQTQSCINELLNHMMTDTKQDKKQ